jgi:ABC-type transporter MlaC component
MGSFYYKTFLVLGLLLGPSVSAQEAQKEKLQGMIDATLDVIYSDTHSSLSANEKQAQVREKIESSYDLDVMIRYAIGKNWRRMNKREQLEVLELVKQLVLKAYVIGLEGKDRPSVTFGELTEIGKARIEIESTMVLDAKTYYLLYRLRQMNSGWQINTTPYLGFPCRAAHRNDSHCTSSQPDRGRSILLRRSRREYGRV